MRNDVFDDNWVTPLHLAYNNHNTLKLSKQFNLIDLIIKLNIDNMCSNVIIPNKSVVQIQKVTIYRLSMIQRCRLSISYNC